MDSGYTANFNSLSFTKTSVREANASLELPAKHPKIRGPRRALERNLANGGYFYVNMRLLMPWLDHDRIETICTPRDVLTSSLVVCLEALKVTKYSFIYILLWFSCTQETLLCYNLGHSLDHDMLLRPFAS